MHHVGASYMRIMQFPLTCIGTIEHTLIYAIYAIIYSSRGIHLILLHLHLHFHLFLIFDINLRILILHLLLIILQLNLISLSDSDLLSNPDS